MFSFFRHLSCCHHTYAVSPSVSEEGDDAPNSILDSVPELSTREKTNAVSQQISSLLSSSTAMDELEYSSLSLSHTVGVRILEDRKGNLVEAKIIYERGIPKQIIFYAGEEHEEVHEGTFTDDLLDGKGTISWPNYRDRTRNPDGKCQTYQGIFRLGKIIEGMTYMVDGTTSVGKYDDDEVLTGEGTFSFPHGGGFYGHFDEGVLTKGKKVFGFNKGYEEGIFNDSGELIEGVRVAEDGTITRVLKADSTK